MKSTAIAAAILIIAFATLPLTLFVGAAGGLLVGWNLLEQPAWVLKAWNWVVEKYNKKFGK